MSEQILENNVAELLKRCHRTISDAQVERSLAAFENRMAATRSPNRWYPAVAAALFVGLAAWIAFKPKAPTPPVPQPVVKAPVPQETDEKSRVAKADQLRVEGKLKEALALIEEELRAVPGSVPALYLRGWIHLESGNHAEAVKDSTRVLELTPKDVKAFWVRAEAKMGLKDFAGALRDSSDAVNIYPWDRTLMTRAKVKFILKDLAGADEDLARALVVSSEKGPILLQRGKMHADLGKDPLADYKVAARLGWFTEESLAAIGPKVVEIFKYGLVDASPETASRIREGLKKSPAGLEVIRLHDAEIKAMKAMEEEIATLIADLGGTDAVRAKAEARLIAIGKPALDPLAPARYHEIPEARVMAPMIAATIAENVRRGEEIAKLRMKVAAIRKRWAARDFAEFESEVLANHFDSSVHYVPMKKVASPFQVQSTASDLPIVYRGTADQLTPEIVEALDKNDGMAFVAMVAALPDASGKVIAKGVAAPVAFGPVLVFTLPDKKGWSAYVVAFVQM